MADELKAYLVIYYGGQVTTHVSTSSKVIFNTVPNVAHIVELELVEELVAEGKCQLARAKKEAKREKV